MRNRFSKIFVDPQGRLGLVSRRSESVISLAANGQLVMESRRAEIRRQAARSPRSIPRPRRKASAIRLQVARWEDGSLAWLDSRGMLHLKSSDRSIPEVTLVLRDGALAGWTSEGRTFGMAYFAGETAGHGDGRVSEYRATPASPGGPRRRPPSLGGRCLSEYLSRFVALLL